MNWIKRLFSKKETTKQCDIHVVIASAEFEKALEKAIESGEDFSYNADNISVQFSY